MTMFERMIQTSSVVARCLSTMDWARSLALAHPRLAEFLLHPNSCIWPWVWHQVWHLKARRRSYKDAVLARWASQACAVAHAPGHARRLCKNADYDINTIEGKIRKRRRMLAEQEALLLQLHRQLQKAKKKYDTYIVKNTENEFYLLLGQTMLPPKEHDKTLAKKEIKKRRKGRKE